jgi:hypothetical protein
MARSTRSAPPRPARTRRPPSDRTTRMRTPTSRPTSGKTSIWNVSSSRDH